MLIARFHAALPGGVPDAIHLLPLGKFQAVDGRKFDNANPAALVAAFQAGSKQLVIDENHGTDYAAKAGFSARAVGHIVGMEVRDDGMWGTVEWNEDGLALLAKKSYSGISAVVGFDPSGKVTSILRAAMTNDPAITGLTQLFHNQETTMELAALRAALGLPDTADEAACLEAARTAHQSRTTAATHLATFAAAAGVGTGSTAEQIVAAIRGGSTEYATLAARTITLETELGNLRTATLQREATTEIDAAIKDGVPILAMRDHYIARFAKDPESVRTELKALPRINGNVVNPPDPKNPTIATLSAIDLEVARNMGIDPAKLVEYRKERAAVQPDGRAA
jgi:phage I-like protein